MKIIVLVIATLVSSMSHSRDWESYYRGAIQEFDSKKRPEDAFPVTDEIVKPENIAKFKKIKCPRGPSSECMSAFKEMVMARLSMIYGPGGEKLFEENCVAFPDQCEHPRIMELAFIKTFNSGVEEAKKKWLQEEKGNSDAMMREAFPSAIRVIHQTSP